MVVWQHQLNGHEFEQTLGDSDGQGSLVCRGSTGLQRVGYDLPTEQQLRHSRTCSSGPLSSAPMKSKVIAQLLAKALKELSAPQ